MARVAKPERILPEQWDVLATEYIDVKKQIADLQKREKKLKPLVTEYLVENGEEDDKGHLLGELEKEFGGYVGIQRQRAVSVKIDPEAAEAVLKEAELWERCAPPQPVIDEEEIYVALQEGRLTDEQMKTMFPATETFRIVLVR